MKICDLTEFYAESSGGVRTYLAAKARYLTETRGWQHVLIVPGAHDAREVAGGAVTYRIAAPPVPFARPYRLLTSARKIREALLRERPDVIEAGSPFLAPWLLRRALAGVRPRPHVVGFYHSDFPASYARTAGGVLGGRSARAAESLAWRYARRVHSRFEMTLAASPHAARRLRQHGVGRVRTVSLGVDLDLFHPRRRDPRLREALGLWSDERLLLYVGRLAGEKGLATLLAACATLPAERYRTLVVGDGPLRGLVEACAASRPGVVWHGHEADRLRLAALYASADLLLAPGPYETFGLTILEAQASGLPVVTVAAGAAPSLVGPGAGLVVPADDPGALASAVVSLTCEARNAMARRARAYAESRFSWDAVLSDVVAAYEAVAGAETRA